jgi:hypothetical protein
MVFGNPELIGLLEQSGVDLFMDGTWDCTPQPLEQTYIIMVYDQQTGEYVPVSLRSDEPQESVLVLACIFHGRDSL